MGGIGIWQLVIVLVIVFMLFGTKRLKGLGADVGEAIQGFRKSMGASGTPEEPPQQVQQRAPLQGETVQQAQTDRQA
ncbi:twin-arginine translocase TatA/TatE family subunit [Pseudomonas fontis]|uniref:Sec-independent protein translocase protein TatA n=1 Tax=Pseudomonas fontis TaxID=2942633 RepID=A0ABT5P055_9PSED|nr:twin-arginine translocase TatA/TatE family subunit [Pseudomonas fontis]MDD0972865.1 twin-arginine translocase TatA/TatE family subunit [Pseudomonas fontis]MDD0993840.1 twin-arginine translocase TatA/TatE family subunit [Pseudomonas fontis]